MATATSTCPNCGAPIEFALGSSLAKICEYCRHTIVRSDRGLEGLGQVADLALTPALIAVGDEGKLGEQPLRVLGRVQLDHGLGPWDEYFVALDGGRSFAWLAYAQGQWLVTSRLEAERAPEFEQLALEQELRLGGRPFFVAELKRGRVLSTEGEFQELIRPGAGRRYADCRGADNAFATIDYGEVGSPVTVYAGWVVPESALDITALGPRSTQKVRSTTLRCPNCGGDIPKLAGERSERGGLPLLRRAQRHRRAARDQRARASARSARDSGRQIGPTKRHLLHLHRLPAPRHELRRRSVRLGRVPALEPRHRLPLVGQRSRNGLVVRDARQLGRARSPRAARTAGLARAHLPTAQPKQARIDYVLGEVYWKCSVGETTRVTDYVDGDRVLSRETGNGEVFYSLSTPVPWLVLAHAFDVAPGASSGGKKGCWWVVIAVVLVGILLFVVLMQSCGSCTGGDGTSSGSSYRGTGVFYGGK